MVQVVLIGIGAGVAAALLFLAPIGGSALAFPLFFLTGLPLAIAALGWGVTAGVIALAAGAAVSYLALGTMSAPAIFAFVFAGPIVWVARLAGFSRSADAGDEWFPLGRLLLHAALGVAAGLAVAGIVSGYDPARITVEASAALVEIMTAAQGGVPATAEQVKPMVDVYVAMLPFTLATFMVVVIVFNLWLGAMIARASGRFARPAVPLWTARPPIELFLGFVITLALAFLLRGPVGEMASLLAGALGCGLALVGLAVLHGVTIGMSGRAILLATTYVVTFFSGLPLALFALLGAADTFVDFRTRRRSGVPRT